MNLLLTLKKIFPDEYLYNEENVYEQVKELLRTLPITDESQSNLNLYIANISKRGHPDYIFENCLFIHNEPFDNIIKVLKQNDKYAIVKSPMFDKLGVRINENVDVNILTSLNTKLKIIK